MRYELTREAPDAWEACDKPPPKRRLQGGATADARPSTEPTQMLCGWLQQTREIVRDAMDDASMLLGALLLSDAKGCLGALARHVAERIELLLRAPSRSGGLSTPRHVEPSRAPREIEPRARCEPAVERLRERMQTLPTFPHLPESFEVPPVLPLPRLLPDWHSRHLIGDATHRDTSNSAANSAAHSILQSHQMGHGMGAHQGVEGRGIAAGAVLGGVAFALSSATTALCIVRASRKPKKRAHANRALGS